MKFGPNLDVAIPEDLNLTAFFLEENVTCGRGDKIALLCKEEQYTFDDLCRLTNQAGNVLMQLGVGLGDRVLLILQDSPAWLAGWFATMKIGAVATHAYTYLPPSEYDYFLNYIKPCVVIVDRTTLENVRSAVNRAMLPVTLIVAGEEIPSLQAGEYAFNELLGAASPVLAVKHGRKNNLAFWNFSGGTTGKPKAVPHSHDHGVFGYASFQHCVHYQPDDVVLRVPKLFFHYARDLGMNWPLRAGATVCLCPDRSTPELIFRLIDKYRPTILLNVPTMMRAMLQSPGAETADLSCLRVCISSGELLSAQLYREFTQTFGVEVINAHGSAEAYLGYFIDEPGKVRPGSSGRIAPLVNVKIVDERQSELPQGDTGVLWVRSPASGQGYHGAPDESRATFLEDNWINTKDLFREDEDGYFWFMGRADDVIKVGGIYVAPLEIEQCLERHPAIKECAVLGIKDSDDLIKTKAFVVLKGGFDISERMADEIKAFCRENIAAFKVPKFIEFVPELPKTGQGKINRRHLLVLNTATHAQEANHAATAI